MQNQAIKPTRVWGRGLFNSISALALATFCLLSGDVEAADPASKIDFNRDVRPILSDKCIACHGPDAKNRKGGGKSGLRLDDQASALADLGGYAAVKPGDPDASELIARVCSDDAEEVMPPPKVGKKLTPHEVEILKAWIKQGAPFAKHWSYIKPQKAPLPAVRLQGWVKNPIDRFILARLEKEGLKPMPEADRYTLIRRLALDLTGLPPTPAEADQFANDKDPKAYEKLVDRLLDDPAYGEHWARMWLDLARYADSAGYADDPPRTIWGYRDYVIRAFNKNTRFDQFTIEQIAGDLLPNPTTDQLIATAFHRNTMTNNEGGTSDEEFRNVAIVDRVNTTLAVWMGTTISCSQCHDHKYDPLPQRDFYRLFAILNNTEDADRRDESPVLPLFTKEQEARKVQLAAEIQALEKTLNQPPAGFLAGRTKWENSLKTQVDWKALHPKTASAKSGAGLKINPDGSIHAELKAKTDVYTIEFPIEKGGKLSALRLETLPDATLPGKGAGYGGGNFVISRIKAEITAPGDKPTVGRFVRIEIPGKSKILSLAEVQVFQGSENISRKGEAKQSSTDFNGLARLAIDGKTDGRFEEAKSTTHTAISDDPWWELDLKADTRIDRLVVWNRTDNNLQSRLSDFRIIILDANRKPVYDQKVAKAPRPSATFALRNSREIPFSLASADYSQPSFDAASLVEPKGKTRDGWAVGGEIDKPHSLMLVSTTPATVLPGETVSITIEQLSPHADHNLARFRMSATDDARTVDLAKVPRAISDLLKLEPSKRGKDQDEQISRFYLAEFAPEMAATRTKLAALKKERDTMAPATTVPIFRELAGKARRKTFIQKRGNFMDLGEEVSAGVPEVFPSLPPGSKPDRLALAKWLVSSENPLTPRVIANRYWEQIFGVGLVSTSEEFGAQGELPSHPELLDWLATDVVERGWDIKALLREMVTSAAYRQSSQVTPELVQRDPENRLLARGPRFRTPAETVRDQALAISGLLSRKEGGQPVKPPQPASGLNAAFGSQIDWETSKGEDRYRRALYTSWRRSNPYPSMTAFDAPTREFCTLKRTRTNTPLQALVTLNDPVFIEAAQALARKMVVAGKTDQEKARAGFRLCLIRQPEDKELARLVQLYKTARLVFEHDKDKATKMATDPLGPLPTGTNPVDLAAWTVVGNVLLNLDETLMKR